ncbi:MAG: 50S ribosomal protein L11 methyltransferase, partial [Candidatus Obscuribacterales bacterium]|nr:50S ribosomal protein L11 methyltransferase [Candidatus Obscuribacterales bacterium]
MSSAALPSPCEILGSCEQSFVQASLEQLLFKLEHEESRVAACAELHELAKLLAAGTSPSPSGLQLKELKIPGLKEPIRVILNPAVFSPEFWGRTFAEGLLKDTEVFHGKKVLELGCGSGWISLTLLLRTGVSEVLGLDINPVAVLLANLNKWLNGADANGNLRKSLAGLPIVKSFRSEVSDLLAVPLSSMEKFDHIVGCIPQVLHPVPEKGTAQDLSYQDLYDLSNYCFNQGILEDRFGLPLIARALEEAQLCLNPQGSLT